MLPTPPRTLTIAGSDSGGGAGIQADLKTFAALGCFGMSAITAITAQNTLGVTGVHAIPAEMVAAQIDAVASDIGVDAAKTGMLGTAAIVEAVAGAVDRHGIRKLVVDPVMISTSGATLSDDATSQAMVKLLFPRAMLVTPNLPEASYLLGRRITRRAEMEAAAADLLALGCKAVLLKGGHLEDDGPGSLGLDDLLMLADGTVRVYTHPRVDTPNLHGTGCTLAAAIAAQLARGDALPDAVAAALDFVAQAIRSGARLRLGDGNGPLNHSFAPRALG
ncbi:hydroxymethylpyrimidine/phosphomethylpyrimidine kinase [Cupriavidus metallidurans]|jgi:hydroxymethylpyrimidine/phosphomethylpyrimidine kinase|uniref:hydroxymethylpyrimidine kinase n=1 Tax=Cupriavidus metallidurans (strain ATCC 43123 / DSM 2839 / NBRC 102507 / CH34) TaxID=266264 RepID=Q1LS21_CUPMC|nr:bifunctional hydroxymethylpyrimidine kinase/phosphomethylpyrimidine kinase [Cupriavidus metallidurans]ABF07055.1 bifunctional hydroxy-methylpyrimidine kinase and hydroxy-phosphomethylpyrimidine kinase [Cupriavidus metallidurans CH34]AVA32279.1 bifunctional hydroxymethylpyrimidine kinase/phosphomethylpyrimidine kinase [Cupriavidus metallidurans]MDE4916478.1 bifunctional hydroxymethylpyrimidine kinase/phosphomethylpyrimidine kinase [Cupriavidus metallidurans]QGS28592.1 bifunctional hydroxymeth